MVLRNYLIDASNLHVGGGVQVGASVVNEVSTLQSRGELPFDLPVRLTCLVSSEVASNLCLASSGSGVRIREANSTPGAWARFPDVGYDSILTIFGPHYRRRRATREVVGFALPRMIYSLEEVGLPKAGLREHAENLVRWRRFADVDAIYCETLDAARRVRRRLPKAEIEVVENCVSAAVTDRTGWEYIQALDRIDSGHLNLASIARDYPHKNLAFLGPLGEALEPRVGVPVRFLVTLTSMELQAKPSSFRARALNMGIVNQRQLGPIYEAAAATVLPTLLEVSSVTPMESLALGRPVFASDLPFIRSLYGDQLQYFSPHDPHGAAETISAALLGEERRPAAAPAEASSMRWTARDRAVALARLLAGREGPSRA